MSRPEAVGSLRGEPLKAVELGRGSAGLSGPHGPAGYVADGCDGLTEGDVQLVSDGVPHPGDGVGSGQADESSESSQLGEAARLADELVDGWTSAEKALAGVCLADPEGVINRKKISRRKMPIPVMIMSMAFQCR